MEEAELKRTLQSLACGKARVLTKVGWGGLHRGPYCGARGWFPGLMFVRRLEFDVDSQTF